MKTYQFFATLVALQLFKSFLACPTGCITCNSQNICQECEQNFQLDQESGVCIFIGCPQYLYFQNKSNQQPGVCQAICDQGYQGDIKTNLCDNLSQCSLTYSSQTGISQVGENIKLILPNQDQYFIIVYSTYITFQLKSTGRFEQTIPFQQNLEYVEYFQDNFYIFQNDNKVARWNIQNNSTELFNFALLGNIDSSTQIITLNNQFGIVITFDRKKSKIYVTLLLDINQQSFVQYSSIIQINQLNNQDYYFFNELILISTSNGIQVLQIYIDQNNNLNTQNYSNQNYCQELNSVSILQVLSLNDKQNIIILNDQAQYLVLEQNSCQIYQIPQLCSQVKIAPSSTLSLYFLQLQTIIFVLNTDLSQVAQIQLQTSIIDFIYISTNNLNMIIAVLDSSSKLNFFSFNLQNFSYQQLNQFQLNNFNPTNLVLINQIIDINNQLNQFQIIAYSKQLQSITLNITNQNSLTLTLTQQYYLKPFQRKITDMQSSVSAIDTNDLNNLATFCSNSGQIMTWDYSTIIKPKLIDSTIINNQGSCQSIQFLVNNQALILFQNSIVALDVIHSKILNTWNFINPLSKMINRFILPQNGISYLLYDSCFKAFDQSYQIIFIDCNPLFDDIIIQAKLDPSMNLVVQKAYSFSVFQVLSNKLNLLATYTSQAQIQIWKIRNFPQDYQQKNQITFEIVSYFSDQSFTIFSQDLKPIVSYQNIQISTAIDINFVSDDPNDNLYVVGGINSQKSASYKYQAFALFKNYTNIFQVTQQNGFNKLFPIYKDINQGNGAIAYTYKVVVNLSYLTVVQSFYYNMLNQDNFYSTNYLSQNVFMNVFQTIKNDQFFMFGDQYGLMTVDATRRKVYTNVYNLNSKDIQSKDFIKGVYQSLILQKFFIIKSNIQVYKLLTNEFIEILEVQLDPSQPVQYFSILESQNIIICIKKNILFVKNYQTNKVYYYTNFSQITNYLVDNNNIYLYGSNLSMLGLDLTEKYSQNNNLDHSIVQQCAFSSIGLVCKKASATIMIFDKNNLNLINTLQQRFLDNNYLFQIDNLYQRIFLYSSNIEIYSFNGNFQKYISSISSQISALQVFTNDISITSTSIFIYDRKSLNYRGVIISPGGGTILSTGYIPELNHLVFYLSVIRFAQIFTINLDNLLTFMSYKNPFTQNQPSVSAGYAYDKDQNLFILLDLTGSLQTIDYQGQFVSWTTTKFVEYDQYSTYSFQGFSLDFQNNNLLVYSQTQVFNLCYGDLTNQVIQFRTNKKQLFAEIADTSSNSLDQTSLSFIVAGDEGLLYKYQNTAFEYFYQLNEEIQSIQYNSNLKLLIIALSQSFVIFNNFDQNSFSNLNLQQNQQQVIPLNNYFSSFICDDVFITKDGLISHYDFANKIVWSTIQLQDPLSRIVKKICSSTTPNIYLGLNNGDLIIYNRNTYQQLTVNLVAKQQGQQYFGLEIGYLVETSTDLWACFSNTQGVFRINLQNQIFQQIIQFDNLNTYKTFQQLNVMIFDVDEQNNRFFLNFIGEKVLRVFDLSGNFLQIISLSGVMYNNIQINSLHILAYTTFHVMIYDRITLQYIQRIRRDNHNDFIVEVIEINSQYIVLLSQSKYEIFQINQNLIEATLMDQVQLQNPIFMNYAINQNNNQNIDQIMQVLLLSQNQVLEQKYNLIYEATQALDKICSMDVSVSTFYDISLSMSKIKPVSFPDPSQRTVIPVTDSSLNNYWNILLNVNDLRNINFQSTLNSLTQVYPIQVSQVSNNQELISLQIYSDSFSSYEKQEVQIRDFKFVFENNLGQITFYDYSQNVTLNNIQIEQQVTDNITFQFANMRQIVFDQIYLKNVSRKFNQNVSDQNYFFDFEYVDYVYIYNLVLDSSNLLNMSFSGLISAQNVQYMTIQNLTIQNSNIYSLIRIQQVENLSIQNLKIINCSNASNKLSEYVLNIIGVTNSTLSNIFISQNFNLQFIYTSNIFQQNGTQYIQQTDILSINSLYTVQNQISFSNSSSLISVQSSFCVFNNITYQNNQGNLLITLSKSLQIYNSIFQNNQCLNGGALSLMQCSNKILIKNSKFQYNQAFASGGAIYLENVDAQIQMDNLVQINKNQALIGGGIRLLNIQNNSVQSVNFNYKNIIFDNDAQLYGKNVGTYLQNSTIGVIQGNPSNVSDISQSDSLNIDYKIIQNEEMKQADQVKFQQILQIFQFQSGGMLNLFVKLIDSEGTYLKFSVQKYYSLEYPDSILAELALIQFKIQSYTLSQDILINGHNIIASSDFDDQNNYFVFTQIQISSMPNQTTSLLIVPSYLPTNIYVLPIYIEIHMRICYPGEIVKQLENNIYSCYSCPLGSYSMTDPTKDQLWYEYIQNTPYNINDQSNQQNVYQSECQKCPDSAFVCQNKTIVLKTGYWRKNSTSTDIVQCSSLFNACDDQDYSSKQGCLQGYMGPVCRVCDVSGMLWGGQRFSQSFINQLKCELCNDFNYQIFFIILAIFILLCYFILSMILFFNSFVHSCICYYLRKIKMVPISRHSILDQSSFYLKILVNYIQISSVLVSLQVSFFPDLLSSIPNYIGDPNTQVIVSMNCVVSLDYIKQYGQVHVIQVLQAFLPLLFLIALLPDQINFFSKQLTCTQVGSERYVTSDLTIQCEDPNYNSFTYPLSIPLIIIWSLFPFIIFKRLQKRSNQLQRCFTLYYFGYYYQEFKEKFYYWEFIRIYLRVIIVVAFTLTSQSQFISYQIVIFILFVYIKFTLYFNPIKNNNLQRFDLFCYQIIILNSLLSTINTEIQSSAISGIIYSLHSVFIFMIVLAIIFFKLNNPLTYIGKCFNKLLSFILPQSVYRRYLKNQGVNWRIYTLWKKIQKNLNLIVQLQAIEKVTQEKSQLKQNQVSQTFDTMLNIKNNDIKQKISLINQVQRSYIHEHSRYKDQTEEIDFIKFGKTSSENSKNNEIQILKDNKSDFDDQIFNDDQSQQTGQIDEINFQSDIYKSNVLRNTLDLNYETKFKLKNSLDFQSKKSFNQTVIQLFKQSLACPRGCNQCNSQNTCYKCEQDFQLDYKLGVCIFNGCQQYLYFQEKDKYQPGVCQSICDQGYQGDDVTNLCINLNKCSLTFNTQTGINQVDENINLVLPYQDLYFVLVYSSYISIQLKQTGVFQQSIPFNQNIQNVQYYQGSFYIFQNDKKVVRWNFEKNNTELFDFALQGSLNQRIQINSLKRDFGIVITQDRKNSKIYATLLLDLNQKSFVQHLSIIQLNSLNNEKYFFFNDIVLITTPQGIQILQFIIDDQNNLKTQSYSNGYQCQNLNDITIQQVLQLDNQQYLVIINDQKFYLVIDQSQCQVFQIPQVCTQIKIASASTFSFYFLQLQNIILVMNYSLSQALQIQMQANIVDFLTISSTTDLNMILAALDSQSNLSFFSFNQKNFGYQQLNQYKLNTFNPTNLVLINQITDKNSQQKQIQIFAYSKQLQSVTFNMTSGSQLTFIQQYFLKPFQRKVIGMQSSVTSIDVNDTNNLVTFCSINGQIMTWDISILIKPKLVDSTFLINQGSCKQIQYLVNNYALILFQNSIIAFDVIYSKLLNTWNFVNQSSKMTNRFILPVNGISFLLYDSCFKSFDQNFELIFQDCNPFFDDIIIEAKLDKSMNLIVQKIYSFSVFKVLTNQLNLSATYTSIAQIQIWKIRNFPQSYQQANKITFEIVSYFSDQSFTIFSQDLNPIKSYSNIPISVALDISFITDDPNDNLYVVGGFTNQNSIDYKYKAFALFKNYTNVFQVIQQSAFNYFFPIYKNFNNQNHSLGYNFKAVVLLNQQTMIQTFYYNMQSQDNFFSSNYLSQNVLANNFLLLKQNQFFILGDQNGLMAVDVARKEIYTKVYSLNQTELTQRDFIQGVQQSLKSQRQSKIPLNQFSTFQYQNNSNNLYLYGSIISILSFDLTEKFSLNNYSDKSIFSMCTLSQIGLICKNKSGTIMTLDKSNLNLITTMQQRFLDINYRFQIDAFYQRIFLYSSNIEVYSFNGNFLMYISSINFYISSLQIFTNDISVTSTSIKIYDRKTLNFRGEIQSPGGATILNTGYIPELNQLVFYVSVIRFAQIFTINLDNLIQVMQYKNQFTQNQPSVCASYEYDKDQNLFILLDQTGNFQTIDYQGQYTSWTTTKFVEYDQYSTYSFTGFSLDFQNNNLLVYSQTQVFNLCYGDLTNQVIQFRANKKQLFVQIADTNLSSQNSTKVAFIIAADQGLLYKYQNTAFEYFYQLNEEIQSIKYNSNLKLLIIALSQTLVIFNEFNQNSLINFNPWQIQQQNIALKSFFSSFICDDLIITKDGVINHYDFINKITLGKIKLQDPLSRIIKKICSSITPNIYLGLNNGDLIIYNRNTYQQFTISLVAKQQGQQYFGLEIGYLVETSTDVWACFSNTQGVFRINLSNQSFQQIIQFDNLNTYKTIQQLNVMVFDVDEQNNRFFLNFIGEKVLRVYDLSGNLLQIISLPGIMYNNMQINSLHILAYTTFHVMIYDRISLQYIQRIRRDNHNDFIVEVIEINSQYIVLLSQSKYEIFQIKQNQIEAALMDQVQLQNPIFMNYVINQNNNQNIDQIMQVLLLSQNQVLEQKYNLIYEATQAQDKICSMDVSVSTFYDISLSMSKIKPVSFPDPSQRSIIPVTDSSLNNYWNILLNVSDIRSINFQSTMNSLTKVYPIQKSQVSNNQELNSLQIFSDSFSSYKNNNDTGFLFSFRNLDQVNIYNLVLDNSKLQNLSFSGLISIFNVKNLTIQNLIIQNSNIYHLISIQQVQNLSINNLTIVNCSNAFNNLNEYVLNIIGPDLFQSLNFNYKNIIFDNNAQLYGKNVGTFLQNATIGVIQGSSSQISDSSLSNSLKVDYKIIQNQEMKKPDQEKFQQILQIFQFQSGSVLNLFLQLIDTEGTYLKFSIQKYYSQEYPEPVMTELKQIQFKIQSYTQTQDVLINGHNIITSSDFDDKNNQFVFTQIQISSMPNSTTYLQIIPYYTPASIDVLPIYIEIQLRICYPGEILKQLESSVYSCYNCPLGSYSMTDPTQDQFWFENISKNQTKELNKQQQVYQSECKKCPDSAAVCQKSIIILKRGYWRTNRTSIDIVECQTQFNACDEQDESSQDGCLRGYIGPVCKMCDVEGKLWKGQRFSQSNLGQYNCQQCNDTKYQIFIIILAFFLLILYFIFSMLIFFNSFVHSCVCYYLRQINLISISRNSIKDKSSFYMKILVNYVKISSILVSLQASFLPDLLPSFSDYISDPISKITININCLISSNYFRQYSQAHITQVIQLLIIITIFLVLFPDQINFFSKQLTCDRVGSELYVASDYMIKFSLQAIEKVTQQKRQFNSNQVKIDLDSLIKEKSDNIKMKISNMNKQSPKRSILFELSKFKDQKKVFKEKEQSEISSKKILDVINLQKKESSNQILEDIILQQGISDELEYKSEVFTANELKKTVDQNYQAIFNRQKNNNSYQQFKQKTAKYIKS
ncbi:hypothetical protein ABPG73_013321 [Tetrahymena malaccensis]